MVLGDCEETAYTPIAPGSDAMKASKRRIPMLYIRGDSIIMVSPPLRTA